MDTFSSCQPSCHLRLEITQLVLSYMTVNKPLFLSPLGFMHQKEGYENGRNNEYR